MRTLLLVLVSAFGAGCVSPVGALYCLYDSDCSGPGGRCLFDGDSGAYCADKDSDCPSDYRWSFSAAKQLIGKCVDPGLLRFDASVPG